MYKIPEFDAPKAQPREVVMKENDSMRGILKGLVESHLKLYQMGAPVPTVHLDRHVSTLIKGCIMLLDCGQSIEQILENVFNPKMMQEIEILDDAQVRFNISKFRAYV